MMRYWIAVFFLTASYPALTQQPYFQQEVNYRISARLDDTKDMLSGEVTVEYINHSPDSLPFLYFHLWANAFRDRTTAYAEQAVQKRSIRFYFAKDSDLGFYESIDFLANGETLSWSLDPENPDIARVDLPQPLNPEERTTLTIPFQMKVPASFSRLGHAGQSYQFTQWYPKPAVYDRLGWHPIPYLDQGEFYSEFGSFDVEITLPANYVVAATGVLQTESERQFLREKVAATRQWLEDDPPEKTDRKTVALRDTFPPSSTEWKTIRYTAEKVHDFAWFADKRFHVLDGDVALASGRRVNTWVFFTYADSWLWKDAISYVNRSVRFYSDCVGEYPYPQATAVMSALSAGGGMEYPMITVIGTSGDAKTLDLVITHEVGHNWFYGILATNERDHPWMDEGINSYYEHRYSETFYGKEMLEEVLPRFLTKGVDYSIGELGYLLQARRHRDLPPESTSNDFKTINYWLGAYEKPAQAFRNLEGYLGREAFDQAMQAYYREWEFRHPYPQDVKMVLERETGKSLDWLFDGYLFSSEKTDYAIRRIRSEGDTLEIAVKNRGQMAPPFALSGMVDSTVVAEQWYDGFQGAKTFSFPAGDYEQIVLDRDHYLLDFNRKNNAVRTAGLFPGCKAPSVRFLSGAERSDRGSLYVLPVIAWNNYDKFQLGIGLHTYSPIQKTVEWHLLPAYAFGSGKLTGLAGIRAHIYPGIRLFPEWTLSLNARRFSSEFNWKDGYYLDYYRISPELQIRLHSAPNSNMEHYLRYRVLFVGEETGQYDTLGVFQGTDYRHNRIHVWSYELYNRRVVNPHSLNLSLEQQSYTDVFGEAQHYLRISLDARGKYTYAKKKHLYGRLFAGYHLVNTLRRAGFIGPGAFNLTAQGYRNNDDYKYDEFYFGRNDSRGLWAQQISLRDAGFKNAFPRSFQNQSGNTNDFMVALNLKADLPKNLPLKLPVKPYFDIAYVSDLQPINAEESRLWWSGGFCLEFGDDIFGIYFPVVNSANLRSRYDGDGKNGYWSHITFTLNIRNINPLTIFNQLDL